MCFTTFVVVFNKLRMFAFIEINIQVIRAEYIKYI